MIEIFKIVKEIIYMIANILYIPISCGVALICAAFGLVLILVSIIMMPIEYIITREQKNIGMCVWLLHVGHPRIMRKNIKKVF